MMTKEGLTIIVNFMTLGGGSCARVRPNKHIVKLHYFFKNLVYSGAWFRQTINLYIVMMTKEWSTKMVNFMTPGVGVLVLRCGPISYIVKIHVHYFFKNFLLYSQAQIRQTEGNDAQGRVYENCKGGVSIRSFFSPSRIEMKIWYIIKQCLSYPKLNIITLLHYFWSHDT